MPTLTLLGTNGYGFTGPDGVGFGASDSYPAYAQAGGPPPGFTGPVAPGYVAAGDPRLRNEVDDSAMAAGALIWQYAGAEWKTDMRVDNNSYTNTYIHFTDGDGTATLTYYGGGFTVQGPLFSGFSDATIYELTGGTAVYLAAVSYYAPSLAPPADLLHVPLPEGLHTIQFRRKLVPGQGQRLVNDGVLLDAK